MKLLAVPDALFTAERPSAALWIPFRSEHDRDGRAVYWQRVDEHAVGAFGAAGEPVTYGGRGATKHHPAVEGYQPRVPMPAVPDDDLALQEGWRLVRPVGPGSLIAYRRDELEVEIPVKAADLRGGVSNTRWRPAIWMPLAACRVHARVLAVEVHRAHHLAEHAHAAKATGIPLGDLEPGESIDDVRRARVAAWWDGPDGPARGKPWAVWGANPWAFRLWLRFQS